MSKIDDCIAEFKRRLSDTWETDGKNFSYTKSNGKKVNIESTCILENAIANDKPYLESIRKKLAKRFEQVIIVGRKVTLTENGTSYETGLAGALALVAYDYDWDSKADRKRVTEKLENIVRASFGLKKKTKKVKK